MRKSIAIALVLLLAVILCVAAQEEQKASRKSLWKRLDKLVKEGKKLRKLLKEKRSQPQQQQEEETFSDSMNSIRATSGVNIRSGPCTTNPVVGTLNAGQTISATGQTASGCGYTWRQVTGSFGTGYVVSNYVEVVQQPTYTPSPSYGGSSGDMSVSQLRQIMPNLSTTKANLYINHINDALDWASINTCLRKSAFLAQLAHESADLLYMEEIASGAAYEGRRDLGNTQPGDGRRYKGRGPIQLTGRANYRSAGRDLGVDLEGNPTLAATPEWGFKVAAWFWKTRSLNQYADEGTQSGFDQVTRRINGGYNGKADRDSKWRRARSVLGC